MQKIICKNCKKLITHVVEYLNELIENPENKKKIKNVVYYNITPECIIRSEQRTSNTKFEPPYNQETGIFHNFIKRRSMDFRLCEECFKKREI